MAGATFESQWPPLSPLVLDGPRGVVGRRWAARSALKRLVSIAWGLVRTAVGLTRFEHTAEKAGSPAFSTPLSRLAQPAKAPTCTALRIPGTGHARVKHHGARCVKLAGVVTGGMAWFESWALVRYRLPLVPWTPHGKTPEPAGTAGHGGCALWDTGADGGAPIEEHPASMGGGGRGFKWGESFILVNTWRTLQPRAVDPCINITPPAEI